MKENTKLNYKVHEIRRLLHLENSFFINFQMKDIEPLVFGVRFGKGFRLYRVHPHPSKYDYYILEIKTLNSNNFGLDFSLLKAVFSINNQINSSPNLKDENSFTISEFESNFKVKFSNPSE